MEPATFNTSRLLWIVAATGLCAGLVAFNQKQQKPQVKPVPQIINLDTIPKKKELKIRNLDEALGDTDQLKIEIDLGNLNVELAKIGPEIEKEIGNAKKDVDNAMKEIDVVNLKKEIETSLADIDTKEITDEVNASLSKTDWHKIKKELEELKEINVSKINIDLKEMNEELKKIKPGLQINLKNIKIDIEKARGEMRAYKNFTDGLENDGLINKKEDYTIKHKSGELIINGRTQPAGVYNKYRSFLEKHKTLSIEKSGDGFNIDHD